MNMSLGYLFSNAIFKILIKAAENEKTQRSEQTE